MKDCSSCEHCENGVILSKYLDMPFEDTPCASCHLMEPHEQEPKTLAQIHYVERRTDTTMGTGFLDQGEHVLPSDSASKLSHKAKTLNRDTWLSVWDFAHGATVSEQHFLFSAVHSFTRPEWVLLHAAHQRGFTASQTTLAKDLGVTKQAVNATIDSLCRKVPSMTALMQKQKRGKK